MPSTSPSLLLRVFAGAIFLSAALLFAVQPMFTKMVLPRLGGTPSVWSVAMVFFQAVLLAGYAYAHALTKYFPGKRSITIHIAVMTAACLFLPLSIATWWGAPAGGCDGGTLAARPVRRLDRAAVLRALRQRSAAAGLVRAHQSSLRRQSLFSLRGEQYRQAFLALLSYPFYHRAVFDARLSALGLGGAVRRADRADRLVRCADAAHHAQQ